MLHNFHVSAVMRQPIEIEWMLFWSYEYFFYVIFFFLYFFVIPKLTAKRPNAIHLFQIIPNSKLYGSLCGPQKPQKSLYGYIAYQLVTENKAQKKWTEEKRMGNKR